MNRVQDQVREFHRDVTKQPCSPAEPRLRNPELRARLILEEAIETVEALVGTKAAHNMVEEAAAGLSFDSGCAQKEPNIIEVIDGLADVLYVCYGTAEDIGIDLEPFCDEIQRSNMSKRGGELRADGKLLKPPGYSPPDIAGVLVQVEAYRLECERLEHEPPKDVNSLLASDWRAMSDMQRRTWRRYWSIHTPGIAWFVCIGCGFPSHRGVAMCDACRPLDQETA